MDLADLWLIVRLTYTSANVLLTGVMKAGSKSRHHVPAM